MRDPNDTEFTDFMAARWPALVRTAYLLTGD
ncbi:MAG: SigE family RNA polymerase sigma factor, partial [Dermatophilaceae bacterium]|nr:SigE family RNA polymerase sigma factor [Dermatophilaceae bacterium]